MRPSDLSGGMKKRVGLARTLALQPEVILYDEPTTGLDPINTGRINHLIAGIQAALKLTSIVVTHDMGTAFSVSDRLVMIAKGEVLMVGTKEEWRHTTNQYVRDFIEGNAPLDEDVESSPSSPRPVMSILSRQTKVGLFVAVGILTLAGGVFIIGDNKQTFGPPRSPTSPSSRTSGGSSPALRSSSAASTSAS